MAAGPQFNLDHEVTYGAVDQVSRLVQRVTCENPSKFTFTGTGTYIIGDERVAIIDPGPPEDAHVDALVAAIDGRTVTHLLITHTHGDHSPAAGLLKHHIDAPTYAFGPHPLDRPDPNAAKTEDDEAGFGFDPIEEDETKRTTIRTTRVTSQNMPTTGTSRQMLWSHTAMSSKATVSASRPCIHRAISRTTCVSRWNKNKRSSAATM